MNGAIGETGLPTGLHTKKGPKPIAEAYGDKTMVGNEGCYKQAVRLIKDPTKTKKNASTFFPDSWSLEDIREAIEYAYNTGKGNFIEVSTPSKGAGMILYFNGDSYFPYFD